MEINQKTPRWAEGCKLMEYLSNRLVQESKTRLRRLVAGGKIKVNGYIVNSSVSLKKHDIVTMPATLNLDAPKEINLDVDILFEDEDHIVINKPAGLPVLPGHYRSDPQLYDWLMMELNRTSNCDRPYVRPHVVHRLDRETTGVLLVAKHSAAASRLSDQFQKRVIKKQYAGIIEGVFPRDHYTADIPLKKANRSAIAMEPALDNKGKEAITEIEVVRRFSGFTFVRMRPLTGRQHQLRVHMAALGYPLAVDFLYGNRERLEKKEFYRIMGKSDVDSTFNDTIILDRMPLHAEKISYRSPSTSSVQEQTAPLPDDMSVVLDFLDKYDGT